ncbi:MAG: hypothetical protein QOE90_3390 [Thermoplasmata archaeon]|nr:hypothetical protein [Thermoplasmata archaeon]
MSRSPEGAAALLAKARAAGDDLEARLLVAAAVSEAGREVGARVVVTGGTAADFYATSAVGTSAAYPALWRPSGDIDVIVLAIGTWTPAREALVARLRELGMVPRGARALDVPGVPFYVEIVADELGSRAREERTMTVLLDGTTPLELRSPENVILAYAESGWHLRHTGDWTRALAVFAAMKERLDLAWMRNEAERRGQTEALERVLAMKPLRGAP